MIEQLELFSAPEPLQLSLDDLFAYLNRKHWRGRLPTFRCEWSDRMITTWGCCYRNRQLIRISSFFKTRPIAELEALLCHEMIHIKYRGHGAGFKRELNRIGLHGDVQKLFPHLNDLTHRRRRAPKYLYQCPKCGTQIRRRRHIQGYCGRCYNFGVQAKFRFVPERL